MRVRIALALAFLATAIGLLLDMSGSAPRLAGDDHAIWPPPSLAIAVGHRGVLCTQGLGLPSDAARMVMTIGSTIGTRTVPLPRIGIDYSAQRGHTLHSVLPAGAAPGETVSLPLPYPHGPSTEGTLCLHIDGRRRQTLEFGSVTPLSGTTLNGHPVNARLSILFYRPGSETWWSLLGALDRRIGIGKSPIFGDWTLPALALAALALWFGVARVLVRELRA